MMTEIKLLNKIGKAGIDRFDEMCIRDRYYGG